MVVEPLVMFLPVADAKVKSGSPNSNWGSADDLRLRDDGGSGIWNSYLKFDVNGLPGPAVSATLRLYVTDGSNDSGTLFQTGNSWTELGITYGNAPSAVGGSLGNAGASGSGDTIEFDVGSVVTGNGTYSLFLTSDSSNSLYLSSREGSEPPELIVGYGPTVTPDFDLSVEPSSLSFLAGGSGAFDVSVSPNASFNGPVNLSFSSSQAAGLNVDPPSATLTPPYAPQSFSVTGSVVGTHDLTVIGSSEGLVEETTASVTVSPTSTPGVFEVGRVDAVTHEWSQVTLTHSFLDPVVVAGPAAANDPSPGTLQIRAVTPTSFEVRFAEWDYLDDLHGAESVSWLVVERGQTVLPSGRTIEAGTATASTSPTFVPLSTGLVAPLVLSTVVSANEPGVVTPRIGNVSASGFEVRLQEQEIDGPHGGESVNWIAWSQGSDDGSLDPNEWQKQSCVGGSPIHRPRV